MALDPSIPLQVKAAQFESPQDAQIRAMQLQGLGQQRQLGALDLQQKQLEVGAQTKAQKDQAAIEDAIRQTGGDVEKALPAIMQVDPVKGQQYAGMVQGAKAAKLKASGDQVEWVAQHLGAVTDEPSFQLFKQQAGALGLNVADAPPTFDAAAGWIDAHKKMAIDLKTQFEAAQKAPQIASEVSKNNADAAAATSLAAERDRKGQSVKWDAIKDQVIPQVDAIVPPTDTANGALRARTLARVQNAQTIGDVEKALDEASKQVGEIEAAKQRPVRVSVNTGDAAQAKQDVSDAIDGMMAGEAPPLLPGRATKEYTQMLAEAHRKGYDLAGANLDWTATTKHISSLNGTQQLKLNQSINALPELLDSVDTLASKWKGGSFPILNKANLALAKGGAYGPQAASIANQLNAQIADVTADLGNVYMGGSSPTDHSLDLAAKALNSNWDEKVLHDMVGMARKNVAIRQNSIKNTGIAGASPNNLYAKPSADQPAAPPSGGKTIIYDMNGKVVSGG